MGKPYWMNDDQYDAVSGKDTADVHADCKAARERQAGEIAVLRGACQRALAAVPPESEIADDLRGVLLITEGRS